MFSILSNRETNLNHLPKTLVELKYSDGSLAQNGINKLYKLKRINVYNNKFIYNLDHLANNLIELDISYNNKINQIGIMKLRNVKKLNITGNKKIYNLDHLAYS